VDWRRVEGRGSRFVRKGRDDDSAADRDHPKEAEIHTTDIGDDSTSDEDEETKTESDNSDRDEEKKGNEAELPWLIGAIPNAIYFEQYLSKQRKHDAALSTALQLRNTLPPLSPGTTHETAPPESCEQNPSPGDNWSVAETHLTAARRYRRTRDFDSCERELSSAFALFPRYIAAWEEYAYLALDKGLFAVAMERFGTLFALHPEHPDVLQWLIRATSALNREERQMTADKASGTTCEVLHVGFHMRSAEKEVAVTDPIFRCPTRVDKTNWLGDDGYDDSFSVRQDDGEKTVTVTREEEMGVSMSHGWGMDLRFSCCEVPIPSDVVEEPTPTEGRSSDHFQVLGVSCDHILEELRAAYRAASFRLHPDRVGGSTEEFARVTTAYECLSEEKCKHAFERGDDLPVRQGVDSRSVASDVERRFFPERFPYRPFGDPFKHGRPNEMNKRIAGGMTI